MYNHILLYQRFVRINNPITFNNKIVVIYKKRGDSI